MKREKTTEGFPVVFSLGDPHGIGPEVILKALQLSRSLPDINPIIFGDPQYLGQLAEDLGLGSSLDPM